MPHGKWETREAYRQSLVAYIGWRNPETIQAYDHHLRQLDYAPIHAALAHLGDAAGARVTENRTSENTPPMGLNVISKELEHFLSQEFGWER
jgi:hypothetical protein